MGVNLRRRIDDDLKVLKCSERPGKKPGLSVGHFASEVDHFRLLLSPERNLVHATSRPSAVSYSMS
jgi:hypothetical protein